MTVREVIKYPNRNTCALSSSGGRRSRVLCVSVATCLRLLFCAFPQKAHNYRSFIFGSICLSNFVRHLRRQQDDGGLAIRCGLCFIAKSYNNLRIDANDNKIGWRNSILMFHQSKKNVICLAAFGVACSAAKSTEQRLMRRITLTWRRPTCISCPWHFRRKLSHEICIARQREWKIRTHFVVFGQCASAAWRWWENDIHDHTLISERGARQSVLFYFRFDLFLSFAIFTSIETKRGGCKCVCVSEDNWIVSMSLSVKLLQNISWSATVREQPRRFRATV